MIIYNRVSGEAFEIDPQQARLNRMRRRVRAWVGYANLDKAYLVMVGLTLAKPDQFSLNMIRPFIRRLRDHYGKSLIAYSWVTEMQARGCPHYHLILAFDRYQPMIKFDKRGWWQYGTTRWEKAKSPWYIISYVGKEYQKEGLPSGARMFTVWVSRDHVNNSAWLDWLLSGYPRWVADIVNKMIVAGAGEVAISRRDHGGGIDINGDTYFSPWVFYATQIDWDAAGHGRENKPA